MAKDFNDTNFTNMEKAAIQAQIADYMLFGLTELEMHTQLEKRFKRKVSHNVIKATKEKIRQVNGSGNLWLDTFARNHLADFYRQRIEELQYLQKNLFLILDKEKAKGDKMNDYKYNQIAKTIIENSKVLADFGLAPPIISKIRDLMPIDINELNKRIEHQKALTDEVLLLNESKVIEQDIEGNEQQQRQSEIQHIQEETSKAKTAQFLHLGSKDLGGESRADTKEPGRANRQQRVF